MSGDAHAAELAALLLALADAGIELAPHPTDPGRLRYRRATPDGWAADLRPDLIAGLLANRAAIARLLATGYTPDGDEARIVFGERLGVADGLGMPTHPGSAAWLIAVGESIGTGCHAATYGVHSGHGTTDEGHSGGGEGERSNTLRDRQGCERGP